MISEWAEEDGYDQEVEVEHVELVKTFAPGVWHCVFDVRVFSPDLT
jgi:tRNA wybutosine-synthesizing protein 2